jgi:hypothetical protein
MAVKLGWAKEESGIFQANPVEKMGISGNFQPRSCCHIQNKDQQLKLLFQKNGIQNWTEDHLLPCLSTVL